MFFVSCFLFCFVLFCLFACLLVCLFVLFYFVYNQMILRKTKVGHLAAMVIEMESFWYFCLNVFVLSVIYKV